MCQTWPDVLTNVFYFANSKKKTTKKQQPDRRLAIGQATCSCSSFQMLSGLRVTVLLTVAIQVIQFTPLLTAKHKVMFLLTAQTALRTRRYKEILNSKTRSVDQF